MYLISSVAARIAELTRQVHELNKTKQVLRREQIENNKLLGEYETALGNIVEMIRNFNYNKDIEKHAQARRYNDLLQEEKDAHLATRLERDDWHVKYMRSVEMIRTAYRLRCEEEETPTRVVAGLQNEVRSYRNALGMEPEKFEDETGYEILKVSLEKLYHVIANQLADSRTSQGRTKWSWRALKPSHLIVHAFDASPGVLVGIRSSVGRYPWSI